MENIIIALLGSSTISVIITAVFNWMQNRKRNSLDYIAEERKKRKKVFREVITGVKQSVYKGSGEENIDQYLDRLEMNINPYGKNKRWNYAKDGHIWEAIFEIRNAQDEKIYEQKKELLINYLYLMVKDDWDKVKKEVKGYSNTIIFIILMGIILILYAIIYIVIFKLDDIRVLVLMLVFNCFPLFFVKCVVIDEVDKIENSNRSVALDSIFKMKRKKIGVLTIFILGFLFCFLINYSVSMLVYPKMILTEMRYTVENGKLYIYTELNTNIWSDLEGDIEKLLPYEVIIGETVDKVIVEKGENNKELETQLEYAIKLSMNLFTVVNTILIYFEMIIVFYFFIELDLNSKGLEREISKVKYNSGNDNKEKCRQLDILVKRVDFSKSAKQENNKNYLGLMFKILEELDTELRSEVSEKEKNVKNVEIYESIQEINRCRNVIKETKKVIKKVHIRKRKIIQTVYPSLKKNVQQIYESVLHM